MKQRKIYKGIFYLYIVAILFLSVYPFTRPIGAGNDKINHAAAFAVFPLLFTLSYPDSKTIRIFAVGALFGLLIEFVQFFLPWRSAEFIDFFMDLGGILTGFICLKILKKLRIRDFFSASAW